MKIKPLSLIILAVVLLLGACSPMTISTPLGKPPTPMIDTITTSDYQAVQVDQLDIDMGMGPPDPVQIIVRGSFPDTCVQIAAVELKAGWNEVNPFTYHTIFRRRGTRSQCHSDQPPLNVTDLCDGTYFLELMESILLYKFEHDNSTSELRFADALLSGSLQIDDLNIEISGALPLPVHAVVSGKLPNSCSQLGEIQLHRDGKQFIAQLVAYIPAEVDCGQDSIPFQVEIPINTANLPEGTYEVIVNGKTASFVPPLPSSHPENVTEGHKYIQIENVEVMVGIGSPLPVDIVASGTWPQLCSQIAEVDSAFKDFLIDITILASTSPTCRPDYLGLFFRFEFPLNIGEMPPGIYTISVNGVSTNLELPLQLTP
jgi:hypothetical protein